MPWPLRPTWLDHSKYIWSRVKVPLEHTLPKIRMLHTKMKCPFRPLPNVVSLQWLKPWRCSNTQIEKLNFYKHRERRFQLHPETLPQHLHVALTAMATVQIGTNREKYGRESCGTRNREWLCWRWPTAIYLTDRWDFGSIPSKRRVRFGMEQEALSQVLLCLRFYSDNRYSTVAPHWSVW
jgi:hypothetical protein